jgi:hypothetical protein
LLQIASPAPRSFCTPSLFQISFPSLLSIRMPLSQHCKYYNNGTLCTVALHPSSSSFYSYMQAPPSRPVARSPSPQHRSRAGARPPLIPTPQQYVFSDDDDVDDAAHINTHSSVSSSQSLPRASSPSPNNRKQQATLRPTPRHSSWRTFRSCAACLAL